MNVLGWTRDDKSPPAGVLRQRDGPWTTLLSDTSPSQTARDRLAMQVRCFDAGIDLLPTAPAHTLTLDENGKWPSESDLDTLWRELWGHGQFVVSVVDDEDQRTRTDDGRAWLKTRKARWDQQLSYEHLLHGITERLNLPVSRHRDKTRGASCDVLAPRTRANEIRTKIKEIAGTLDGPPGTSLSVTGLWPPFGFVNACNTHEVAR